MTGKIVSGVTIACYASTLSTDSVSHHHMHQTTTEKELLAIVFAFEKFRSYLLGTHVIVYTDH